MLENLNLKEPYSGDQVVIIEYLKNGVKQGKQFFKARYIARDLGMTPRVVGVNLRMLSDGCQDLKIEKWGYSRSTTWRVEAAA